MKPDKQYITQITADDLREIARAANLRGDGGVQVVQEGGALVARITEAAFKRMAYAFCRQAWPGACTELSAQDLDNISLRT